MRFTSQDMEIVRTGLDILSFDERQILICRYWENQTIEEISNLLGLGWSDIDQLMSEALEKLRTYCLQHSQFSIGTIMEAA